MVSLSPNKTNETYSSPRLRGGSTSRSLNHSSERLKICPRRGLPYLLVLRVPQPTVLLFSEKHGMVICRFPPVYPF